ncbi:exosortase/archaeosortase family protein [Chloroflexota bacterium]
MFPRLTRSHLQKRLFIPIIIFIAISILFLPVYTWLIREWLHNPYYGHGFLIPIASGFIFWLRRDSFTLQAPSNRGLIILGTGILLYLVGYVFRLHYLSALALPVIIYGVIVYLYGINSAKRFMFPILILIFMIPLPFVDWLGFRLQLLTTYSTVALLQLSGIDVSAVGNQIALPNASFTIGIACSGINSLISMITISAIIAFIIRGSLTKRMSIIILSVPIALFTNILRVTSIILIAYWWDSDIALDFFHNLSGIIFFLLAIAVLVIITKLIRCNYRTFNEIKHD